MTPLAACFGLAKSYPTGPYSAPSPPSVLKFVSLPTAVYVLDPIQEDLLLLSSRVVRWGDAL